MRPSTRALLREPLTHCLAIGFVLYIAFSLIADESEQRRQRDLIVDQVSLVNYLVYQTPGLSLEAGQKHLQEMDSDELEELIEAWVREEVLYREAKVLGLQQSGYAERRRLINQLTYINEGFLWDSIRPDEETLRAWFQQNHASYVSPPQVTFTHVFFGHSDNVNEAEQKAKQELSRLNRVDGNGDFDADRGQHFLYHRNYVKRNPQEVASHFGERFAREILTLTPDGSSWQGPLRSDHGFHVIRMIALSPERTPEFSEVRTRVERDFVAIRVQEHQEQLYRRALRKYRVTRLLDTEGRQ